MKGKRRLAILTHLCIMVAENLKCMHWHAHFYTNFKMAVRWIGCILTNLRKIHFSHHNMIAMSNISFIKYIILCLQTYKNNHYNAFLGFIFCSPSLLCLSFVWTHWRWLAKKRAFQVLNQACICSMQLDLVTSKEKINS